MPNAPLYGGHASALHDATVGTGVGSLSGWGAALLVIALLGAFAWWATRSSPRRRRREAKERQRREAMERQRRHTGLDLRDRSHWPSQRRD
jgi:predicted MFS family arabinose efflux permease